MRSRPFMGSAIATMKASFNLVGTKMKTQFASIALATALVSACGGSEPADPYADLGEETLLVRFEANPDVEEGKCNPNVHYALRTSEEYILLNANFVVGDNITGSGISLANLEDSGVARTTSELNMFDAYEQPCSELNVQVQDLSCRTEAETDNTPCPSPQYEGTEMFGSFRGLPNY